MKTPQVSEEPLRLEPTTVDPFLGDAAACPPGFRELDRRQNDGIDVRLLWNQVDDQVTVAVFDAKTGAEFEMAVAGHEARDAFLHPYAHAASRRIDYPA